MTLFKTVDGKKKLKRNWLAIFIVSGVLLAFLIFIISVNIYNFVHRDYREEGRKNYLNNLKTQDTTADKKNVVIILLDDMGYGDLSLTGSQAISTPNIDSLANNGVFYTNYYAPNPICSASRAGMLSGRYPARTLTVGAYMDTETMGGHFASWWQSVIGHYLYGNTGLPTDEILLPEVLQSVGYNTSLFGKWHLGVQDKEFPTKRGFDRFLGALYSDDMNPYRVYDNEEVLHYEPYDQSNLTKELTAGMTDYIHQNKDNPFFMYYASPFPHYPANASKEWLGTSQAGIYGDCMQEVDWSVGQIVDTLKQEGILEDTLIIFTSDNGPWYEGATGGQRGRKATKFNGGSHVPMIVSMPGTVPAGQVDDDLVSGLDFFPTILSMLDIQLPQDRVIDGIDMWDVWQGKKKSERHELFINAYMDSFAYIEDNFKYMEKSASENSTYWNLMQGPFLFDMSIDPEEAYDVSTLYPEQASKMKDRLDEFKKELDTNIRGWIK